jgi:hypothetical protein
MKECITLPWQTVCDGIVKISWVYVNSLECRCSSGTYFDRDLKWTSGIDVMLMFCTVNNRIDAVRHLASVESHNATKVTKPEHAKSRETRASVFEALWSESLKLRLLSPCIIRIRIQWFPFLNSNSKLNLVLYATLGMVTCSICKIWTQSQQPEREETFGLPFGKIAKK